MQAVLLRLPPFVLSVLHDAFLYNATRGSQYSYIARHIRDKYLRRAALTAAAGTSLTAVTAALSGSKAAEAAGTSSVMNTPRYGAGPTGELFTMNRMHKKRRRDGGGTVEDPNPGGAVVTTVFDRTGIKLSRTERLMKMLGAGITRRLDRFGNATSTTADSGAYTLSAYSAGSPAWGYFPMYLVDLTGINQNLTGAVMSGYPRVMYRLKKNGNTSSYVFEPMAGVSATDGATTRYVWETVEGKAVGNANSAVINKAFMGHFDIDMVITGATKYSSHVTVKLIQFENESMAPNMWIGANTHDVGAEWAEDDFATNTALERQWDEWLTSEVDYMIDAPLNKKSWKKIPKPYKTLYQKKFKFHPTSTIENNSDGHDIVFRLNYDMDKVIDYQTYDYNTNLDLRDMDEVDVERMVQTSETLAPNCNKKGRVYLMIKGSTTNMFTAEPTATQIKEEMCTFDLVIHRTLHKLRAEAMG